MGKRIVIALGGNALGNNLPEQMVAVKHTAKAIVDGAFQESVLRSAPYFSLRIDGITELNNN